MKIQTELIPAEVDGAILHAIEILHSDGLVAFPTDTVYGVGCLAFNARAVENIYKAKKRPMDKAIPILIGSSEDLGKVAVQIPPPAARLVARYWPGPLTLVLPKHPDLPDVISDKPTVGVRVPDHPIARQLLQSAGPMAVTSANLSGRESPRTADQVLEQLGGRIHLILDGGETPGGMPSTVVNCLGGEPMILRQGPISQKDIQFLLT
jgi:L-threonylcarbamoyladenylate synthase